MIMQITFGEILGLIGTMITVIGAASVTIWRFSKLENCVDRLEDRVTIIEKRVTVIEEKLDLILSYLSPGLKRKKIKVYHKR